MTATTAVRKEINKERKKGRKTTSKCFLQRNEECCEFRIIRVMLK
jgi:hypothetical protein